MTDQPSQGYSPLVEFHADKIVKKYVPDRRQPGFQERKFWREARAYMRFEQLGSDFVPKLFELKPEEFLLIIERIQGPNLCELVKETSEIHWQTIINRLIEIDDFLFRNRINYLFGSPADVLVSRITGEVYLIDFEYTFLDETFNNNLLGYMRHPRIKRIDKKVNRDLFLEAIDKNLPRVSAYRRRLIGRLVMRGLSVARHKEEC